MKKCILCKNDQLISYGDDIFGEVFCKDCYDKYSCLHCKKMNIRLSYCNNIITEVEILKFHGSVVNKYSILTPLFQPGHTFRLYCKDCWDSGETERDIEEDENSSIEPEEDDEESYYSEDEEEDYELNGNLNLYYTGKGKHDLY